MTITSVPPSPQAKAMLEALRESVAKSLEKKKRLGQYAVIWRNGRPVLVGDDAPAMVQK